MKQNTENPGKNPGRALDQAIDEIRNTPVMPEELEQASANVRFRLQEEYYKVVQHPSALETERIQSCADFRALIPAYLTSSLTPSRRLLFEDHIRECVGCRKALQDARRGSSTTSAPRVSAGSRRPVQVAKWIAPIAAALLVAVALQTTTVRDWLWPIDVHAVVQMVDGSLFSVGGHTFEASNPESASSAENPSGLGSAQVRCWNWQTVPALRWRRDRNSRSFAQETA